MLRPSRRHALLALLVPLAFALGSPSAPAQIAPARSTWQPLVLDSGAKDNPSGTSRVVWSQVLRLEAAVPWARLRFAEATLGAGSAVRVHALEDGDQQTLAPLHLKQWGNTTAYLNGSSFVLELIAGPGTTKNRVVLAGLWVGGAPVATGVGDAICGTTDNRVPSGDARVGRLLSSAGGCTAWIIERPTTGSDRCHLSAGHCSPGTNHVLQFNVPTSSPDCSLVMPAASDQYAVDTGTWLWTNTGLGDDWMVFRCFPNPTTGLTTYQSQQAAFDLDPGLPSASELLQVTGFGVDGSDSNGFPLGNFSCTCSGPLGARNQTQQTGAGFFTGLGLPSAWRLFHRVDTCSGNSGGPVIRPTTGRAVAIHTNAGCEFSGRDNSGTLVAHPAVQSAIQALAGSIGNIANDECSGALALAEGANGPFSNIGASDSLPLSPCGAQERDLWFHYTASCTGTATFSTCGSSDFDTVIEVFRGTCRNLIPAACDDDTCGREAATSLGVSQGELLVVRVGGFGGAQGSFSLDVRCRVPNDECLGAVPIADGFNGPFSNIGATTTSSPAPCLTGRDVWFVYTPSCSNPTTFSLCGAANFDTTLELYEGSCRGLSRLDCNDDACGQLSELQRNLLAGRSYYLRVGGFSSAAVGTFSIRVEGCQPSNDECTAPLSVRAGSNGRFSNEFALDSARAWLCGPAGKDVWFRHVATCDGLLTVETCGAAAANLDTVLEIRTDTCSRTQQVLACDDDSCGALSRASTPVVSGQRYLVRVGTKGHLTGWFSLRLSYTGSLGAHTRRTTGCGAATIDAFGAPTLGARVGYSVGNTLGTPLLWLGLPTDLPFCPPAACRLGALPLISLPSPLLFEADIPCDPSLLGTTLSVQGADVFAPGGCASGNPVEMTLTDTIDTTVG